MKQMILGAVLMSLAVTPIYATSIETVFDRERSNFMRDFEAASGPYRPWEPASVTLLRYELIIRNSECVD